LCIEADKEFNSGSGLPQNKSREHYGGFVPGTSKFKGEGLGPKPLGHTAPTVTTAA